MKKEILSDNIASRDILKIVYDIEKECCENNKLIITCSEEEKNRIFSVVDFALNPMMSGSGANLKMFDYMAAGIPIITTEFGTRGIDIKDIYKYEYSNKSI